MIYSHVAAALLGAAIAATATWQTQNWRYGEQIAKIEAAAAEKELAAVKSVRAEEAKHRKGVEDALKEAAQRAQQNAVAAAAARSDADRLRSQLATTRNQLATAPADAVREYAATATEVLGECVREYQEVAKAADAHASDVSTLQQAWPKP